MTEALASIKFGTDGWRAIIAREFTFANLERVAQAYVLYLIGTQAGLTTEEIVEAAANKPSPLVETRAIVGNSLPPLVVIGYDRRFLSEQFAQRAAEVMVGNDFRIALFQEAAPTPLISWAVKELCASGGIVLTASHNPPDFNGFKIKAPWGGSAAPETTAAVEKLVDANPVKRSEISSDGHGMLESATKSYREQIASYIDLDRLRDSAEAIVVDPMHGSGGRWVDGFLSGGRLKVETIRGERDPLFGGVNPEPIDRNLGPLKQRVVKTKALAGLATDGDADRVGAVSELGQTMTMHDVVPLVLLHLARNRKMTGGVVRTFSQSVLLGRIAAAHNLKIYETPIGFKYIADLMLKEDILIGAEESGGIGVKGHIPERDGILNSLLFLEAIVTAGKPPSELLHELHQEFGEFHFGRRDLHTPVEQGMELVKTMAFQPPSEFAGRKVRDLQTIDGVKLIFTDESWLLFRQSGTEPVLRIYAEATSINQVNLLLDEGQKIAFSLTPTPNPITFPASP